MFYNHLRQLAGQWDGSSRSLCPHCDGSLIPKRGDIVRWHWAHRPGEHARRGCPYVESPWHLHWKAAHLALGNGWQIEYPLMIDGQQFFIDAANPQTKEIREFVHSLSPAYLEKHRALYQFSRQTMWIFDGIEFISKRARHWKTKNGVGIASFLKQRAYDIARHLPCVVHQPDNPQEWDEWKSHYDLMGLPCPSEELSAYARMRALDYQAYLDHHQPSPQFWHEWKKKQGNIWFASQVNDASRHLLALYSDYAHEANTSEATHHHEHQDFRFC